MNAQSGSQPSNARVKGGAIRIRPAGADEIERIAEIAFDEVRNVETIALVGDTEKARRYLRGLLDLEHTPNPTRPIVVAIVEDTVVGELQYSIGPTRVHGRLKNLLLLASIVGPLGLAHCVPQLIGRLRVDIPIPPGSFHIANVSVDAASRDRGIGTELLTWAERTAERLGAHTMSLEAMTTNRAITLYERLGYRTTVTRTHPWYGHTLNGAGRCLMEKPLTVTSG